MPGLLMYYDDIMPTLLSKGISDEEARQLIIALFNYSCKGEAGPVKFVSPASMLAWDYLKNSADKARKDYDTGIDKKQYASFCREYKKRFTGPLPVFEEYQAEKGYWYSQLDNDISDDNTDDYQ